MYNEGKHSWNIEAVKALTKDEFIKQCEHLTKEVAGAEYDKIVPPKVTKKEAVS